MKRPSDLIESLEAAGKRAISATFGDHYPLSSATPKNILELIRYVQILEKALENAIAESIFADNLSAYIEVAERELFPTEKE